MSFLEKLMEHSGTTKVPRYAKEEFGYRARVSASSEFHRIDSLPRRTWNEGMTEEVSVELTSHLKTPSGTMALRPIQAQALHDCVMYKGGFFPIGVGGGKALISLLAPVAMEAKRPMLVVPASLRGQTDKFVIPQMMEHWCIHPRLLVVGYSELSLVKNANLLEEYGPDLIIFDECFVAGTRVQTKRGNIPIENILKGEEVLSFDKENESISWQKVNYCFERESSHLVDLIIDNQPITATLYHPFLTSTGWKNAEDLNVGDQIVRVLPEESSDSPKIQSVLFEKPCRSLSKFIARISRKNKSGDSSMERRKSTPCRTNFGTPEKNICVGRISKKARNIPQRSTSQESTTRKKFFGENEEKQSDARSENTKKGFENAEENRAQTKDTRRKRKTDARASKNVVRSTGVANRIRDFVRSATAGISNKLQSRYSLPRSENRCGSARKFPLFIGKTGSRPEEKRVSRKLGLASVQRVEPRNIRKRDPGVKVYNLEVENTHTYILESGDIVHNCHYLKNKNAGRTKRVVRYFKEHPETRCIAMSGTVSNRSIRDYAHIIHWCLKGLTPVPLNWNELSEWADCIDEKVADEKRVHPGALAKWCVDGENARQGFRRRLVETPGVVASKEGALGTSLVISQFQGLEIPSSVKSEIDKMRGVWETPNGDIITEAIEMWRHIRELSLGFYGVWDPPAPRDWLDARRTWKALVRETIKGSKEFDTELQVWNFHKSINQPDWMAWAAIKDSFKPNPVANWLNDFALTACGYWLYDTIKQNQKGIIWTAHRALGHRLGDVGIPYFGAGDDSILTTDHKVIGASIQAHGEGKNLERFQRNLIVCPPTSGKIWEQVLGRTHRPGQEADEVTCEVFLDVPECRESFEQARRDARYLEDSLGNVQKLNYADIVLGN